MTIDFIFYGAGVGMVLLGWVCGAGVGLVIKALNAGS